MHLGLPFGKASQAARVMQVAAWPAAGAAMLSTDMPSRATLFSASRRERSERARSGGSGQGGGVRGAVTMTPHPGGGGAEAVRAVPLEVVDEGLVGDLLDDEVPPPRPRGLRS